MKKSVATDNPTGVPLTYIQRGTDMKHNFNTAFHKYACHLQDNLGQSASSREYICRETSALDSSGAFVLRDVFGNESARVNGDKVTP